MFWNCSFNSRTILLMDIYKDLQSINQTRDSGKHKPRVRSLDAMSSYLPKSKRHLSEALKVREQNLKIIRHDDCRGIKLKEIHSSKIRLVWASVGRCASLINTVKTQPDPHSCIAWPHSHKQQPKQNVSESVQNSSSLTRKTTHSSILTDCG